MTSGRSKAIAPVAAGIGHLLRRGDARGLALGHFRETIGPIRIDPVRGAGVEQFRGVGAEPLRHRRGLARGVVRQTQDHRIHRRHHVAPRRRVLAQLRRHTFQRHVRTGFEPGADAEPGGAGFAVDEHAGFVRCHRSISCSRRRDGFDFDQIIRPGEARHHHRGHGRRFG
jgi:hypothetical protein